MPWLENSAVFDPNAPVDMDDAIQRGMALIERYAAAPSVDVLEGIIGASNGGIANLSKRASAVHRLGELSSKSLTSGLGLGRSERSKTTPGPEMSIDESSEARALRQMVRSDSEPAGSGAAPAAAGGSASDASAPL